MRELSLNPNGWPQLGVDLVQDKVSSRLAVQGPLPLSPGRLCPCCPELSWEVWGRELTDPHALKTLGGRKLLS